MKKDKNKFPVTHRDWIATVRDLPGGLRWVVLALIVGLVIKALFIK